MTDATILVQANRPPGTDDLADALTEALTDGGATEAIVVRTVGAYDLVATIEAPTDDELARAVLAAQTLDGISRTLTLPHV